MENRYTKLRQMHVCVYESEAFLLPDIMFDRFT